MGNKLYIYIESAWIQIDKTCGTAAPEQGVLITACGRTTTAADLLRAADAVRKRIIESAGGQIDCCVGYAPGLACSAERKGCHGEQGCFEWIRHAHHRLLMICFHFLTLSKVWLVCAHVLRVGFYFLLRKTVRPPRPRSNRVVGSGISQRIAC